MPFFDAPRKRVTKKEFETKLRYALKSRGLNEIEIESVELLFQGHLNEDEKDKGISEEEIEDTISWLRDNPRRHKLEIEDIAILEEELKKLL